MPGRIELLTMDSGALAGNPLGDPARRSVPVWLPPSYDDGAGRRHERGAEPVDPQEADGAAVLGERAREVAGAEGTGTNRRSVGTAH